MQAMCTQLEWLILSSSYSERHLQSLEVREQSDLRWDGALDFAVEHLPGWHAREQAHLVQNGVTNDLSIFATAFQTFPLRV